MRGAKAAVFDNSAVGLAEWLRKRNLSSTGGSRLTSAPKTLLSHQPSATNLVSNQDAADAARALSSDSLPVSLQ